MHKDNFVTLRLSEEEKNYLQQMSEALGISKSDCLRRLLLCSKELPVVLPLIQRDLTHEALEKFYKKNPKLKPWERTKIELWGLEKRILEKPRIQPLKGGEEPSNENDIAETIEIARTPWLEDWGDYK